MTIYEVDLINVTSMSKLPSTHLAVQLCHRMGKDILVTLYKLLDLVYDSIQNDKLMSDHMTVLEQYKDLMDTVPPVQAEGNYNLKIRYLCFTTRGAFEPTYHYCNVDTLDSVTPPVLMDTMYTTLKNGLICALLNYTIPQDLFSEWDEKIKTVNRQLKMIFPYNPEINHLVNARACITVEDDNEETKWFV
jgi:hypothetical protein